MAALHFARHKVNVLPITIILDSYESIMQALTPTPLIQLQGMSKHHHRLSNQAS